MYVYCLFCESGKCEAAAAEARRRWGCRALCPKQVQRIRKQGRMLDVVHELLPGYVFLYAEQERLNPALRPMIGGCIRVLQYMDQTMELQGGDEQFALRLLETDGVIGKTQVYQEGQMIRLKEGAFAGLETRILKVNRRSLRMQIEIPFAQSSMKTWVEYEVVAPASPKVEPHVT